MSGPILNKMSSGYRAGGVEGLAISQTSAPTPPYNSSLENQITVAENNLGNAQEIVKTLCAFNERLFGNNTLGIEPLQENPILITGQLSRLHFLQNELYQHLSTIRSIVNAITEV